MNKAFTLAMLFMFMSLLAAAQDVLVKKNGTTLKGKVTEVGVDRVFYRFSDDPNSAVFVIRKNVLSRIEFANGEIVVLDERDQIKARKSTNMNTDEAFGRSLINFSPFKALDSGPGFGLSYEAVVDKRGLFGIVLPLTFTFPESGLYPFEDNTSGAHMFYVEPGLKIYPFGQRKVTYAVGPSLFTGFGERDKYINNYDPVTGVYTSDYGRAKTFRFGLIVNNYVNFQITQHFQLGLNGGLGSRYIEDETFRGVKQRLRGIQITGEFNFNLGFRF
ncbi:hypothetical protein [Dyadobacter sandarakinus]|uniref:Outer membrane protein beta-barrel domain-containing protein n=1 Tax=Dyadobacter sandarakinus TaxID=2747268 RepID=A0ABX7I6F8_9BACT|nr:hypothetical protein [Dyadobacter sandarakinus]QRR01682.1 hypothetical protein HWI92_12575 [Dyadobacter sandarakinus]